MKKTYMTPELLAVTLQHQDNVLAPTSFPLEGPGTAADVKEFEFVDDEEDAGSTGGGLHSIWDSEW